MNAMQLPLGLIPAVFIFEWVTPAPTDIPWILAWGLFAHYTMARALKLADITIIFPLDFLRLPLMALLGYLLYAEAINPWTARWRHRHLRGELLRRSGRSPPRRCAPKTLSAH